MDDSVFEQAVNGKKKSLRVYLINPPAGDDPWRTKGDYRQEQKEAHERHAMFQEQHRLVTEVIPCKYDYCSRYCYFSFSNMCSSISNVSIAAK